MMGSTLTKLSDYGSTSSGYIQRKRSGRNKNNTIGRYLINRYVKLFGKTVKGGKTSKSGKPPRPLPPLPYTLSTRGTDKYTVNSPYVDEDNDWMTALLRIGSLADTYSLSCLYRAEYINTSEMLQQPSPGTTDTDDSTTDTTEPSYCTLCKHIKVKSSTSLTITQAMLKEKKYNILSLQEEKLKVEIEHIELEKIKLQLQISSLNPMTSRGNNAVIAL